MYQPYEGVEPEQAFYENTDLVEIDDEKVFVQSLEFYYENAKPDDKYYPMVENYLKKKNA